MSLGDFIRSFFSRKRNPQLRALEQWVAEHKGVEGYIEPRTTTSPTTLLLVDRDGAHARAPARDPEDAAAFCDHVGIPVYDARVVGYPRRLRDYDRGLGGRAKAYDAAFDREFAELERRLRERGGDAPSE